MIIGVTCAVVTAMVIAGVLVGVKFFLDSTNDIVKVVAVFFCNNRFPFHFGLRYFASLPFCNESYGIFPGNEI